MFTKEKSLVFNIVKNLELKGVRGKIVKRNRYKKLLLTKEGWVVEVWSHLLLVYTILLELLQKGYDFKEDILDDAAAP